MSFSFSNLLSLNLPTQLDSLNNNILLIIASVAISLACLALIINRNLLNSVINLSIFSLCIAIYYLLLDAPDVAMTEVALGACLSSCVFLNVIRITGEEAEKPPSKVKLFWVVSLCLSLSTCLIIMSSNLPEFGNPDTALQQGVSKYYLENTHRDIGLPSIVAAILASYRGFDTFGETIVILIAGLAVLLIKSGRKGKNNA